MQNLLTTAKATVTKKSAIKCFFDAQKGGVAIIVGAAAFPLVIGLGLAVDAGLLYSAHSKLQGAVDAAALASVRAATSENGDIEGDARMFFNANFPEDVLGSEVISFDPNFNEETGEMTITANIELSTSFMRVAGITTIPITVSAKAEQQLSGIEIAMVLDVTGSMGFSDPAGGTRIESLKTASETLLDTIYGEEETIDDVRISVVPYTTSVNLGSDRTDVLTGFNAAAFGADGWKGCVEARFAPHDQIDTSPSLEPFTALLWPPTFDNPSTARRENGFNTSNDPNRFCTDSEVLPLTAERSTISDHIDDLVANGATLTNIGFSWGWRTISPSWQGFWGQDNDPVDYDHPTINKAIIFMTDGVNSLPSLSSPLFYSGYGFLDDGRLGANNTTAEIEANNRLLNSCELAKQEGIEVYTIMFALNNATVEQNFRNCATSSDHFFDAPNGDVLEAAFKEIAGQLSSLRLTQ